MALNYYSYYFPRIICRNYLLEIKKLQTYTK